MSMKTAPGYDPFVYDADGEIADIKHLSQDPRCLFGWGPPSCGHRFGHCCAREFGHRGRCWDGDETSKDECSQRQRPRNWDTQQRQECNPR